MRIYLLICAASIASFTACTKKKQPSVPSIYGLWQGKYAPDSMSSPSQDVFYRIDEDNTVHVYNGADTATAKQKGKSFSFAYYKGIVASDMFYTSYTYPSAPTVEFAIITQQIDPTYKSFKGIWYFYVNGQALKGGDVFANKVE
jgi:hypothetical protein